MNNKLIILAVAAISATSASASRPAPSFVQNIPADTVAPKELVIPEGTTEIAPGKYHADYTITSAVIPDGVTTIGYGAFAECANLKSVTLPSTLEEIGEFAFANSSIKKVTIPKSVKKVGQHAFEWDTEVVWEGEKLSDEWDANNVAKSGAPAEQYEVAEVPDMECDHYDFEVPTGGISVSAIRSAMSRPAPSGAVVIPDGTTWIKAREFVQNPSITSVEIPESVTNIGEYAFFGCRKLDTLHIPSGVRVIARYAFFGCPLTHLTIDEGVEEIGLSAFGECQFTTVTLPNSLKKLAAYTFRNCPLLKTIYVSADIYAKYHFTYPQMVVRK